MFCTYYCLPNIRCPWVAVFGPHRWGRGVLRCRERAAVTLALRPLTDLERVAIAELPHQLNITWRTERAMLDSHRRAAADDPQLAGWAELLAEAVHFKRAACDRVLAEVSGKRAAKKSVQHT